MLFIVCCFKSLSDIESSKRCMCDKNFRLCCWCKHILFHQFTNNMYTFKYNRIGL